MTRNKILLTAILALSVTAIGPAALSFAAPAAPTSTAKAAPKELGSITGTVVDSAGKPVVGAIVRLHHHRHMHPGATTLPGSTTKPAHPFRETTTAANGNFSFANVHPGHHLLVARDKGVGHAAEKVDVEPGQAATANLTLEKGKAAGK